MTAPAALPEAIIAAARLRRDRRVDDAVQVVEQALSDARATPLEVPFRERILLSLTLADLYLSVDGRDRARSLLATEVGFADQILQVTQQSGSPDQVRAASAGCLQLRDRAAQVDLLGHPAPEMEAVDWVQGAWTTFAAQRGRVVLLEFWAPWCRSCTAMVPFFRDLHVRYAGQGLTILGLTSYRDRSSSDPNERARERDLIRKTIAEQGVDFAVGIAPDGRLQARYGANGIPTFALIDREGTVQLASSKPDKAGLEGEIVRLLEDRN